MVEDEFTQEPMNKKNLAQKMREFAENNQSDYVDSEFNKLLGKIGNLSSKGKTCLYLYGYIISEEVKKLLIYEGFTVDSGGLYNEINTVIKW
jgi:hypothetical protein